MLTSEETHQKSAHMAERQRRPRREAQQHYVPPNARQTSGQPRKIEQIVGFVKEAPAPKETPVITANADQKETRQRRRGNPKTHKKFSGAPREFTHGAPKVAEVPEENTNPGEIGVVLNMELRERVVGTEEDIARVAAIIEAEKYDCHMISLEGRGVQTHVELLKLMGPYFSCTLGEGWSETRRKVIKTKIPRDSLEPVVEFLHRGKLKLTTKNVGSIFVVAEYLQIECLIEACRNFMTERIDSMLDDVIILGAKHISMAPVVERAWSYACQNFSAMTEKILSMDSDLIMSILSRDDLNVKCEDEVCDFVVKWLKQKQDAETVRLMIDCVRMPHLTEAAFEKLSVALKAYGSLPLIDDINDGKFAELPEDQLARRLLYDRHVHGVWRDARENIVPKYFHLDERLTYQVKCLRSRNETLVSTDLVQTSREFRRDRLSFELVPVMNSLVMITHGRKFKDILIYRQQRDGRWERVIKYERSEATPDFASSVFGSELYLCVFNGFNSPLKTLAFRPLNFADAEEVKFTAPIKTCFSPPRMYFRKDLVIYMQDNCIDIFDRISGENANIPLGKQTGETKMKFSDILVYEDKLYAYESPATPPRFEIPDDRLHVICLKKKVTEAAVEIVFPPFKVRESRVVEGEINRSASMRIIGSRLVLHKYFATHDASMILEFDPEKNTFNKVAEMPCSGATYYNRLVTLLPVHLHRCKRETLLQKYCNSLSEPAKAADLEKLLFYL